MPCWRPWSTPPADRRRARLVDEVWGDEAARQPGQGAAGGGLAHPRPDRARGRRARRRRLPPRAGRRTGGRARCCGTRSTEATAAEGRGDRVAARDHARRALAAAAPASGGDGPLADPARRRAAGCAPRPAPCWAAALSALGDHREALPLLEEAGVGDEETAAALLRSEAAVRGPRRRSSATSGTAATCAERLGIDPGPSAAPRARRAARRRPPGAHRAALRRRPRCVGRDDDIRALRALVGRVAGGVDPRRRRPRQDPAGPRARPRGRAAGRALRRARRRHLARGRRRRGRLGARRARLGQRPPRPDARAAPRRPRPDRAAARRRRRPCSSSTTASTWSTRSPTWWPSSSSTRPDLRVLTTTRAPLAIAAERVYLLGAAPTPTRLRPVRRARPRGAARVRARRRGGRRASCTGSTACRWRSSWPRRRCGRCRSRRSTAGSRTGSRCCAAATAARPTATRRCSRSSTGRGTCSTSPSGARCAGSLFHDGFTLEAAAVLGDALDAVGTRDRRCWLERRRRRSGREWRCSSPAVDRSR